METGTSRWRRPARRGRMSSCSAASWRQRRTAQLGRARRGHIKRRDDELALDAPGARRHGASTREARRGDRKLCGRPGLPPTGISAAREGSHSSRASPDDPQSWSINRFRKERLYVLDLPSGDTVTIVITAASERFPERDRPGGASRGVVRVPQVTDLGRRRDAQTFSDPRERSGPDRQVRKGGSMKHGIRWALVSVGLAGVVMAVTLAPGGATPPAGLTNTLLALGRNTSGGTIPLKEGTNIVVAQITVIPGGSSGWHSHPGGAIVVVQQGSLTVYESVGDRCEIATVQRGSELRRATWRTGSSHQHGHGPVHPVRHLPAGACGCVSEDRRAEPGHLSGLRTRPSDVRIGTSVSRRLRMLEGGSDALQHPQRVYRPHPDGGVDPHWDPRLDAASRLSW